MCKGGNQTFASPRDRLYLVYQTGQVAGGSFTPPTTDVASQSSTSVDISQKAGKKGRAFKLEVKAVPGTNFVQYCALVAVIEFLCGNEYLYTTLVYFCLLSVMPCHNANVMNLILRYESIRRGLIARFCVVWCSVTPRRRRDFLYGDRWHINVCNLNLSHPRYAIALLNPWRLSHTHIHTYTHYCPIIQLWHLQSVPFFFRE